MQTKSIPQHIAVIMDGNRRWAKAQGLPMLAGHKKVADEILEPLVEHAAKIGVKYMTLWAFSTENWNRSNAEVSGIMKIFRHSLTAFGEKMHRKGIRIRFIGDLSRFDTDIQKSVAQLAELTKNNTVITVIFAINYGGRDEILRAFQKYILVNQQPSSINHFSDFLDTSGIPDPELIIRTGGEQRLSGFLLWQSQYSELYFPSWYMPEFTPEKLDNAIAEFQHRQRRFGT